MILRTGSTQFLQNLDLLHIFVVFLQEAHFPKEIKLKTEIISMGDESNFHINHRRRQLIQHSSVWSNETQNVKFDQQKFCK